VIDANSADPVAVVLARTDREGADVVVEAVGHPSTTAAMLNAVRVRGTVLVGGLYPRPPAVELRLVTLKELRLVGSRVYEWRDVQAALSLLASGAVDVDGLVTRIVPLANAVDDGFRVLERSRSEMKVLLRPGTLT
jgi:(R,R)-butanediol dehydrogenase / meso-butanediol dehydrogenase / diacetyl reductase